MISPKQGGEWEGVCDAWREFLYGGSSRHPVVRSTKGNLGVGGLVEPSGVLVLPMRVSQPLGGKGGVWEFVQKIKLASAGLWPGGRKWRKPPWSGVSKAVSRLKPNKTWAIWGLQDCRSGGLGEKG